MDVTRTTVRLKKDYLKTLKLLALEREQSLTEAMNSVLASGLSRVLPLRRREEGIKKIDKLAQESLRLKVRGTELYRLSKADLK